jgi:hypothetical protein
MPPAKQKEGPTAPIKLKHHKMEKMSEITMSKSGKGKIIILIGARNTGKSTLIRDWLYHHRTIPAGMVISGTEDCNSFYTDMIPSIFVHHEYNESHIQKLIQRQKSVMKKFERNEISDPRAFLILDDLNYDPRWVRDKIIRYLFMNGRHLQIHMLIALQYPLGIPPDLRTNINYALILRDRNVKNQVRIHEHYAGVVPDFRTFKLMHEDVTRDFGCLVIDNDIQSESGWQGHVRWYKAAVHPKFNCCDAASWRMEEEYLRKAAAGDGSDGGGDGSDSDDEMSKLRKGPRNFVKKLMGGN